MKLKDFKLIQNSNTRLFSILLIVIFIAFLVSNSMGLSIDIKGTVTSISEINDEMKILVDSVKTNKYIKDKAYVTINNQTKIYDHNQQPINDKGLLKVDKEVEVIFDGPIKNSYPAQGTARIIFIK